MHCHTTVRQRDEIQTFLKFSGFRNLPFSFDLSSNFKVFYHWLVNKLHSWVKYLFLSVVLLYRNRAKIKLDVLGFFKIAVRPDLMKKKMHIFRHDPNSSQGLSVNNFKFSFINTFRSTKSKKLDYYDLESTFQIENTYLSRYVSYEISVSSNHWQIICVQCKYIIHICLMVSTDQADPSCFYFSISWILMELRWFYFFVPSI